MLGLTRQLLLPTVKTEFVADYTSYAKVDLVAYENGSYTTTYTYGENDEKISQSVYHHVGLTDVLEGKNPLTQIATTNIKKAYYHKTRQGSTAYVTDKDGQVLAFTEYDAWGKMETQKPSTMNFAGLDDITDYTGHTYDEVLEKYFAQARFYDATNKRFITEDPIKDGLNWYAYTFNNPISFIDIDGLRTYLVNGIRNPGDDFPETMKPLYDELLRFGVTDVRTVPAYTDSDNLVDSFVDLVEVCKNSGGYTQVDVNIGLGNTAQVTLSHKNDAINNLVNLINEDLKAKPLKKGEKLNLIGYSGGGTIVLGASEGVNIKVNNVILIGAPFAGGNTSNIDKLSVILSNRDFVDNASLILHPKTKNTTVYYLQSRPKHTEYFLREIGFRDIENQRVTYPNGPRPYIYIPYVVSNPLKEVVQTIVSIVK